MNTSKEQPKGAKFLTPEGNCNFGRQETMCTPTLCKGHEAASKAVHIGDDLETILACRKVVEEFKKSAQLDK